MENGDEKGQSSAFLLLKFGINGYLNFSFASYLFYFNCIYE